MDFSSSFSFPTNIDEYRAWWKENAPANVSYGYCWCGCGQETGVWPGTDIPRLRIKGASKRFLLYHQTFHRKDVLASMIEDRKRRWAKQRPNISYGYCWCGCGEKTALAKYNNASQDMIKGHPRHFIVGHSNRRYGSVPYIVEDHGHETPCWIWQGGKSTNGYGSLKIGDKRIGSHRAFYEEKYGLIPDDLELDHLCCVPACCNPDHLEPVTHRENMRRYRVRKAQRRQERRSDG